MTSSLRLYALWFVRLFRGEGETVAPDDEEDTELFIGFYRTETDARAAIERLREKPGFRSCPDGFEYHERLLNKFGWADGFISFSFRGEEPDGEFYPNGDRYVQTDDGSARDVKDSEHRVIDPKAPMTIDDIDIVYDLWFHRVYENRSDTLLSIGTFTSLAAANGAVERVRNARGFRVFPAGFVVIRHAVGVDGWSDGYLAEGEVPEGEVSPEWTTQPCDPKIDGRFLT